jgi:hypothetical protein
MDGEEVKTPAAEQPPAEEAAAPADPVDPAPAEGGEPPAAGMEGEAEPAAQEAMEAPADMEGPVSGDMEEVDMGGEPAEDEFDYSNDERKYFYMFFETFDFKPKLTQIFKFKLNFIKNGLINQN